MTDDRSRFLVVDDDELVRRRFPCAPPTRPGRRHRRLRPGPERQFPATSGRTPKADNRIATDSSGAIDCNRRACSSAIATRPPRRIHGPSENAHILPSRAPEFTERNTIEIRGVSTILSSTLAIPRFLAHRVAWALFRATFALRRPTGRH